MSNNNDAVDTLPDVLVEYISSIIWADDNTQYVRLVPIEMGCGFVQEIIFEPQGSLEPKKVFGFPPVDVRLRVVRQAVRNENLVLSLVAA